MRLPSKNSRFHLTSDDSRLHGIAVAGLGGLLVVAALVTILVITTATQPSPKSPPIDAETPSHSKHQGDFTVATYNIRTTMLNEWDNARAHSILSYLRSVDIMGVQEGVMSKIPSRDSIGQLQSQSADAHYAMYGEQRGGEYRAIFWRSDKFTLLNKGNYTLDANRNLVWVELKTKQSGTNFYFMTTHLDYARCRRQYRVDTEKDCPIRENQAVAISTMLTSLADPTSPVILAGDMNAIPGSRVDSLYAASGLKDAYQVAKAKVNTRRSSTIAGYRGGMSGSIATSGHPIDHIYVKNGITVPRVELMNRRGSDHIPLEADIVLPHA